MVDGQEKPQDASGEGDQPNNQSDKETGIPDTHPRADAQKLKKTMSFDFSTFISILFSIFSLLFSFCLVIAAFLTFIAICFQAFIYNSQLREMKKSSDASTKAANSAEAGLEFARESAHLDQRAWIGVTGIKGDPVLNQPFIVIVTAKNSGKTFAKKVRSYVYFLDVPAGDEPDFSSDEKRTEGQSTTLLAPNGDYLTETDVLTEQEIKTVTQAQLDAWNSGKKTFLAAGKISYEDIFGCEHWTTFCFYLRQNLKGYSNHEKHNDADDNRCP